MQFFFISILRVSCNFLIKKKQIIWGAIIIKLDFITIATSIKRHGAFQSKRKIVTFIHLLAQFEQKFFFVR